MDNIAWPEGDFLDLSLYNVEYGSATSAQMQEAVDWAVKQSLQDTPSKDGADRHEIGRLVQTQNLEQPGKEKTDRVHYDGSDVVVIAFEGTGGYHPRKAQVVQAAAARLRDQGLRVDGQNGSLAYKASSAIDAAEGQSSGWSGLTRGPLEQLIRDPELSSRTQWFSFASEEIEAMSGEDAFMRSHLKDVLHDSLEIYTGEIPGLQNALKAVSEIQQQAREQGKNPRFVLVSHSSGGTSLVKFLERARAITGEDGKPLQFEAALTIDPVREAHEAFFEGAKELFYKGTEHNFNKLKTSLGFQPKRVYPPLVRHRDQPETLFKPSNVKFFKNYYQLQDTEGLKIKPYVGIQGSKVMGADNQEIPDVGTGGHGEIAVHQEVRDAFVEMIERVLKP